MRANDEKTHSFTLPCKTGCHFCDNLSRDLHFQYSSSGKCCFKRSLNDAKALLSLLTDQVLINLEQVILTTQRQVFNLYNSLDVPDKMHELDIEEQNVRQATQNLQYSVNQMVSAVYPYDFVLVRTLDGMISIQAARLKMVRSLPAGPVNCWMTMRVIL